MNEQVNSQRLFKVLLVEDNPDDAWLTQRAFKRLAAPVELHVAVDGVDALKFLRHEPPYSETPTPDLILLDLNMPRMDGHELLGQLKSDERLRVIPAIVLSTSDYEKDVYRAYSEFATAYMTKPLYLPENTGRTKSLFDFWLGTAILPSAHAVAAT